jgi:hypothetical protein
MLRLRTLWDIIALHNITSNLEITTVKRMGMRMMGMRKTGMKAAIVSC